MIDEIGDKKERRSDKSRQHHNAMGCNSSLTYQSVADDEQDAARRI